VAEIRPTRDDAERELWLELRNAILPDDAISLDNLRSWMTAAEQVHLLAYDGDELAAVGIAMQEPWHTEPRVRPLVPPQNRRLGLGSAVLAELSRWCASRGAGALLSHVELGDEESLGFAERRGFAEIGRELQVALDLTGELLVLDPPPGVEIVTWAERPELVGGLFEVHAEGTLDIPGNEALELEPFEDWLEHDMSGSGDRPEWTFVAVAGDEVVGYSKWSMTSAQPTVAHHDLTAVRRAWRGRGIAGALKSAQLAWAKEHGYTRAVTNNEERNAPIRRLNERFGYRPAGGLILMRGPLVTPA
jgi:GNAT superfamily N-acetyltransferase